MTLEREPVRYLQNDVAENESALLELADSCHLLAGIVKQNRVLAESKRVAQSVHAVVKRVYHGKANAVDDCRGVDPVSPAEGNEL